MVSLAPASYAAAGLATAAQSDSVGTRRRSRLPGTTVYTSDAAWLSPSGINGRCSYAHRSGPPSLAAEAPAGGGGGSSREIKAAKIAEKGEGERTPASKTPMGEASRRGGTGPERRRRDAVAGRQRRGSGRGEGEREKGAAASLS